MDLPKRKNIRLNDYNYSSNGAYFITICTKNKENLLWKNVVKRANCVRPLDQLPLSKIGIVIENEIYKLNTVYENIKVDKYQIMPNHIHLIIFIYEDSNGRTQFAPTISRIIKQFKGSITKQIGFSIWQKSFYDRIIRNENEYQSVWNYIHNNPLKYLEVYPCRNETIKKNLIL
ncbi:transposase [Clostridium sp. AM09-51]|nr:transposase [Clostridium sp. AM09-51]